MPGSGFEEKGGVHWLRWDLCFVEACDVIVYVSLFVHVTSLCMFVLCGETVKHLCVYLFRYYGGTRGFVTREIIKVCRVFYIKTRNNATRCLILFCRKVTLIEC